MRNTRCVIGRNITTDPMAPTIMNAAYGGSKGIDTTSQTSDMLANHAGKSASTGNTAVSAAASSRRPFAAMRPRLGRPARPDRTVSTLIQ